MTAQLKTFKYLCMLSVLIASKLAFAGEISVTVTDLSGNPLQDAVVYAEPANKQAATPLGSAMIAQKGRTFIPLVTVVQTGASVTFPNNDTVRHHVYSFSPAKTFELKLYSGVPAAPVIFDKPGIAVLGCNIHDQMIAYVNIVDTPYFTKTDVNGKAKLSDLPNGSYQLKTWHYAVTKENYTDVQAISVKGSEQAAVKLDIQANALIISK
jgi:plastocyanin